MPKTRNNDVKTFLKQNRGNRFSKLLNRIKENTLFRVYLSFKTLLIYAWKSKVMRSYENRQIPKFQNSVNRSKTVKIGFDFVCTLLVLPVPTTCEDFESLTALLSITRQFLFWRTLNITKNCKKKKTTTSTESPFQNDHPLLKGISYVKTEAILYNPKKFFQKENITSLLNQYVPRYALNLK